MRWMSLSSLTRPATKPTFSVSSAVANESSVIVYAPGRTREQTVAEVRSDDITGADRNVQPVQGDICA